LSIESVRPLFRKRHDNQIARQENIACVTVAARQSSPRRDRQIGHPVRRNASILIVALHRTGGQCSNYGARWVGPMIVALLVLIFLAILFPKGMRTILGLILVFNCLELGFAIRDIRQ
jgi:hypothetical protein